MTFKHEEAGSAWQQVLETVEAVLGHPLAAGQEDGNTPLADLDIDSLALVNIIVRLDEIAGGRLALLSDGMAPPATLGDLVKFVQEAALETTA